MPPDHEGVIRGRPRRLEVAVSDALAFPPPRPVEDEASIVVDDVSASYHIRLDSKDMMADFRRLFRREDAGGRMIPALRDLTFDVRKGSVLAVIGRNGAGKSTL